MGRLLAVVSLIFFAVSSSNPAAAVKTYKNCQELRLDFAKGVSAVSKFKNLGSGPIETPRISKNVYDRNKRLDLDRDGIICEVLRKNAQPPLTARPAPSPSPSVEPGVTLENLDPVRTSMVAQEKVASYLKLAPGVPSSSIVVRKGPSLSDADIDGVTRSILNSLTLFAPITQPAAVNATWFSGKDADWVDAAITDAGANPRGTPTGGLYSNWIASVGTKACNMGNAGIGSIGPYLNQCIKSGAPPSHDFETASHEYFHTVQYSLGAPPLPFWFMEGGATFVGIHVGGFTYGNASVARDATLSRYATRDLDAELRSAIAIKDLPKIQQRLLALESANPAGEIRSSAYPLGMLIYEGLVAWRGVETLHAHLADIKPQGFEGSIQKHYGVTLRVLYEKIAPYIASELTY